jgi:NAD(P)-dependent dehydrogenase (short-subunit alcohol dehydrogenase family)
MPIAIVTGAGSGIGRAVAVELAGAGWSVTLAGRRREALESTAAHGGDTLVQPCDVTSEEEVAALFAATAARWGRVDFLFNNAGIFPRAHPIDELPVADWRAAVEVNLTGAFLCLQAAFRQMKAQTPRGGRIVNNGSISAYVPRPRATPYTATKHAITGLTRAAALDGRGHDIAVGQIDIGNAASEMTAKMGAGVLQADGTTRPEPIMDVAHVARTVRHMAELPLDANILFATVMATDMPYVGRG